MTVTTFLCLLMLVGNIIYAILFPFYRFKGIKKAFFLTICFSIFFVFFFYAYQYYEYKAERKQEKTVESIIIIKKGSSLSSISKALYNANIINKQWQFKTLAALNGVTTKLKSGRYKFTNTQSIEEILNTLVSGSVFNNRIRIPEGIRSWELASLLSKKLGIDSTVFIELIHNKQFIASFGIKENSLEGYLFPDTYKFQWDASPSDLIRHMVKSTLRVFRNNYKKNHITKKYSMEEIITMASIVEGEAGVDKERELIAGVFYNRLRLRMPLGADPTVRFALKKFTGPLKRSELRISSPYNTRRFRGLPPGPIGNPSKRSIIASINPLKTDMLYFVAKDDGSREHFFTTCNNDHVKMKKVAAKNRKNRKM